MLRFLTKRLSYFSSSFLLHFFHLKSKKKKTKKKKLGISKQAFVLTFGVPLAIGKLCYQ